MNKNLLDRPIAFHRCFAELMGSITYGVFLGQLYYWATRDGVINNDGWFYKTSNAWFNETMLSRYELEAARKKAKELGILEEKKEGVPCKLWFKLDFDKLFSLLETSKLASESPAVQYARNQQTSIHRIKHKNHTMCASSDAPCVEPSVTGDEPEMTSVAVDDDGNELVKVKGLKRPVKRRFDPFSDDKAFEEAKKSVYRHKYIAALYLRFKGITHENWDQYEASIARNIKAAKLLIGYQPLKIARAMEYCQKRWGNDWSLEAVPKWITHLDLEQNG